MIENDIVFVIANETSSFFHLLEEDPAVNTIVHYLKKIGINSIAIFPNSEEEQYIGDTLHFFRKFLDENKATFYCFSTLTSTYRFTCDMLKMVRFSSPDAIIIIGGVHFNSHENIVKALNSQLVDIVFKGGAKPFINFMSSIFIEKDTKMLRKDNKLYIEGNIPESGIHYINENNKIEKKKSGTFPFPVMPVVRYYNSYTEIRSIFRDYCSNRCDYCFIKSNSMDNDYRNSYIKTIINTVKRIKLLEHRPLIFSLSDSSPFSDKNSREITYKILKDLKNLTSIDGFSVFIDPSNIDEYFFKITEELGIFSFFIGRDRITEDPFVGRRLKGKLRTQEMLDKELNAIKLFIKFLENNRSTIPFELFIGYIISPYEMEETSNKLLREIIELATFTKVSHVKIQFNIFILSPYPGTKIAEKSKGEFIPLNYFYHPYPNVWISESAVNLYLEMIRLIVAKVLCADNNYGFYKHILQLSHDIQYNNTINFSLIDEIEDNELKTYAKELTDIIISLKFGNETTIDKYFDNIMELYYLGSLTSILLNKTELLKRRYGLLQVIKDKDKFAYFVKKDLNYLKELALKGKVRYLKKYCH